MSASSSATRTRRGDPVVTAENSIERRYRRASSVNFEPPSRDDGTVDVAPSKGAVRKGVRVRIPLPVLGIRWSGIVGGDWHRPEMHDVITRQAALDLLRAGVSRREVCRILGVGYNSTY